VRSKHQEYLWRLYDHAVPESPGREEPSEAEQFPLRVVAPAFVLSELTTAFFLGFGIYLPFLVIELVVATVLSAMGLFLLPPVLVGLPIKLVLFVLADGWMLVADMLLRSFGSAG
jgi:flagellar biosynthetic protein FliP